MQRVRRGALVAVLVVVGAFVLAGCRSEPGAAAYVGDQRVSNDRVDAVLDAIDQVNAGRTADAPPVAIPASRQLVLGLIVYGDLAQQLIDEKGLQPTGQNIEFVAQGYGIPIDHPYAQLLGNYLNRIDILTKNAGTAAPTRDQILRYYHVGVDAQIFQPGLSDEDVVQQGSQAPAVVALLNVQTMLDDLAKKQSLTVNPRYAPLPMPVLLTDNQRAVIGAVPFGPDHDPFVTDASGATA